MKSLKDSIVESLDVLKNLDIFKHDKPSSKVIATISDKFYDHADDIDKTIDKLPEVKNIPAGKIVPTQSFIQQSKFSTIASFNGRKELPFFIKYGDLYYIFDGHHRTAYQIINKLPVNAKVFSA